MDRLGKFVEARITNWDENSIFLCLNSPNILNGNYVDIEIHNFGRVFKQSGHVVCEYVQGQGIGIELSKSNAVDQFNWSQFFNICEDMGHISKLTR
jgi:hypothetical protein